MIRRVKKKKNAEKFHMTDHLKNGIILVFVLVLVLVYHADIY